MNKSEVLQTEIDWFEEAYKNSENKGFSSEYRRGFKSAIAWLEIHRDMAKRKEVRDGATTTPAGCPSGAP